MLTPDALAERRSPSTPAEVRKQYDDNLKQYAKAEERQASHILIAVKPDASDADKAAAKSQGRRARRAAREEPGAVRRAGQAEFAGPRLGRAGRRPGLVRARRLDGQAVRGRGVRRQAGRHRRSGADRFRLAHHQRHRRSSRPRRRSSTRPRPRSSRISSGRRRERKFAEAADQFQNLVYEQADSLQPVAKALNLQVQTHAAADARADSGAGAGQREVRAGGVQPGIAAGKAQYRSDRGRRRTR